MNKHLMQMIAGILILTGIARSDDIEQNIILSNMVISGSSKDIDKVIAAGGNIFRTDMRNHQTYLHYVAANGNTTRKNPHMADNIAHLIKLGLDPNATDEQGLTPLFYAAYNYKSDVIIPALIKGGANVNAYCKKICFTPLMFAVSQRNLKAINQLLAAKADIKSTNEYEEDALLVALKDGSTMEILKILLAAGADVKHLDKNRYSCLHIVARKWDNPAIITMFAKAGADINAKDRNSWTPLHWAAYNNKNPAIIKALIDLGAKVNVKTKRKLTALQVASNQKNMNAIRVLKAAGAK